MQTKTDNSTFVPDAWTGIDVAKNTLDAALHPLRGFAGSSGPELWKCVVFLFLIPQERSMQNDLVAKLLNTILSRMRSEKYFL